MDLTMDQLYVILALSAIFLASVSLAIGVTALIQVLALKASTHSIQYMPIDSAIDKENDKYLKSQSKWATSDKAIKEQEDLYKEDIKDSMPEFSVDENDSVISY